METDYIAVEDCRDPDLRVIRVATAKVPGATRWTTSVQPKGHPDPIVYDSATDPQAAFRGHRAICRAVRLGHDLNEELAA